MNAMTRFSLLFAVAACSAPPQSVAVATVDAPSLDSSTQRAAYPARVPILTEAAIAGRADAFRARNPGRWLEVRADEHGFIRSARTDDPAILPLDGGADYTAADLGRIRGFLERNADFFGVPAAEAKELVRFGAFGVEINVTLGRLILGQVTVSRGFVNAVPVLVDAPVTVDDEAAGARVVDRTYQESARYTALPPLDCNMVPGGGRCVSTDLGEVTRTITLRADDIEVITAPLSRRKAAFDELRLVKCVHPARAFHPVAAPAGPRGARGPQISHHTFSPPLPLVVDAVTGETLEGAHIPGCDV
jgi:hypothetical protein